MLDFSFAHPTCNDELANRLANKTVKIKPNIKEFTESGIIFEDETEVQKVDSVIFATGYKFSFPLIEHGNLIPVEDNQVSLYLNMFAPELSDHNSLAILGLVQPWGSIMPISEIQARLFFDSLTGNTKLPKKHEMLKLIEFELIRVQSRYVKSPRHTIQVDYGVYMEEIGEVLGCVPNVFKLMFTDPVLAWSLWTGPATAYTYRLAGPFPWDGARKAILETKDRIFAGMAPDGKYIKRKNDVNYFKVLSVILLIAIFAGIFTNKLQYANFTNNFFGN
uniref:Flavin-containing monooxygenase n=1 Tax=Panagrolaimus davidi TaxID=227884 RepID=A0A914PXJ2_9BILA